MVTSAATSAFNQSDQQMTTSFLLASLLVLILLPIILLLRATESRTTRINRMRRHGMTWQQIADHYGVSRRTVGRWVAEANAEAFAA
jgi:DNA-binding NarL/FixJ family response regulator